MPLTNAKCEAFSPLPVVVTRKPARQPATRDKNVTVLKFIPLPIAIAYAVALACFGNDQIACFVLVCFMVIKMRYYAAVVIYSFAVIFFQTDLFVHNLDTGLGSYILCWHLCGRITVVTAILGVTMTAMYFYINTRSSFINYLFVNVNI